MLLRVISAALASHGCFIKSITRVSNDDFNVAGLCILLFVINEILAVFVTSFLIFATLI
jgi:hypothetical protein